MKKKVKNLSLNREMISNIDIEKLKGKGGPGDLTKDWYMDDDGYYVCISFFCP